MLMLYFSGTGNSRYIANLFSQKTGAECYSIEEKMDFRKAIEAHETLAFCYPIYGSYVPRIMREFVATYTDKLKDKKVIIFCTQLMFSGDGARVFTDLLPEGYGEVIYAEHFNMPNNICNVNLFRVRNGEETKRYIKIAQKKMEHVVQDLNKGKIKKRGFNKVSHYLGKSQSAFWPEVEERSKASVKVDEDCIQCNKCVKLCPMKNLKLEDNAIQQKNNCILCYRCVNACPKKAITVLVHKKPKKQYKGIKSVR